MMSHLKRHFVFALLAGVLAGFPIAIAWVLAAQPTKQAEGGVVRLAAATDHVWYLDPHTGTRAFIGSADDALMVARRFGIGISNKDLLTIPPEPTTKEVRRNINARLRDRLRGSILLQVEDGGTAWYLDPADGRRYRLGAPEEAWRILRSRAAVIDSDRLKSFVVSADSPSWLRPPEGFKAEIAATGFMRPRVLAWDPKQNLVVSDFGEKSKVIALVDDNGDGRFDRRQVLLRDLLNGHGLAFAAGRMYVAKEHWLEYWPYDAQQVQITGNSTRILSLPPGGEHFPGQGHKTRTIAIGADGMLYLSIGSACDHCGDLDENEYSVIKRMDLDATSVETFARGLRNTVFFVQDPASGEWWGNDMGVDNLGDELPPDEINHLVAGKDYGWPFCYYDRLPTPDAPNPEKCATTTPPVFSYTAHSAPLGLRVVPAAFKKEWAGDFLSALHGSTVRQNRLVGYRIVHVVRHVDGAPVQMDDAITGFLREGNVIVGRPVDMLFSEDGSLFVSDDYANVIHKIRRR